MPQERDGLALLHVAFPVLCVPENLQRTTHKWIHPKKTRDRFSLTVIDYGPVDIELVFYRVAKRKFDAFDPLSVLRKVSGEGKSPPSNRKFELSILKGPSVFGEGN
jgi:hypothetical protein